MINLFKSNIKYSTPVNQSTQANQDPEAALTESHVEITEITADNAETVVEYVSESDQDVSAVSQNVSAESQEEANLPLTYDQPSLEHESYDAIEYSK